MTKRSPSRLLKVLRMGLCGTKQREECYDVPVDFPVEITKEIAAGDEESICGVTDESFSIPEVTESLEYQISSSIEIIDDGSEDDEEYEEKEIVDVIPQEYLQARRNVGNHVIDTTCFEEEEEEEDDREEEEQVEVFVEEYHTEVVSIETQTEVAVEDISTQVFASIDLTDYETMYVIDTMDERSVEEVYVQTDDVLPDVTSIETQTEVTVESVSTQVYASLDNFEVGVLHVSFTSAREGEEGEGEEVYVQTENVFPEMVSIETQTEVAVESVTTQISALVTNHDSETLHINDQFEKEEESEVEAEIFVESRGPEMISIQTQTEEIAMESIIIQQSVFASDFGAEAVLMRNTNEVCNSSTEIIQEVHVQEVGAPQEASPEVEREEQQHDDICVEQVFAEEAVFSTAQVHDDDNANDAEEPTGEEYIIVPTLTHEEEEESQDMGSILSLEYEEEESDVIIPCPYVRHGCEEYELTGKELERHITDSATHHLKLCEEYISHETAENKDSISLHTHIQEKLNQVTSVSGCVDRIVRDLEDAKDEQLNLVKKVFMDSLAPFHEIADHVKELEKFVHRVEYFVEMVHEHTLKFDKKAMLDLSLPRTSDPTTYSHPLRCCKISTSDSIRFDKDRIYGHYLKMSKKISTLKSMHHNSVIVAKDVVEKLQKREECDLETHFTEAGLQSMHTNFSIKADSFLDVLNESYTNISSTYRDTLLDFINNPDVDHYYTDYYIWKVDALKLTKDNVCRYYKTEPGDEECESDIENSFSIWASEDYNSTSSGKSLTGTLVVEYTVQIWKSDISGGVFLYNQHKLDRVAPTKLFISRMKNEEENGCTIFSVVAEFPFTDIEHGSLVDGALYFNTVIA